MAPAAKAAKELAAARSGECAAGEQPSQGAASKAKTRGAKQPSLRIRMRKVVFIPAAYENFFTPSSPSYTNPQDYRHPKQCKNGITAVWF